MNKLFEEPLFIIGYNAHGYWSTLREIYETEVQRDNEPLILLTSEEIEPYDELSAIWVCPDPMSAFRYVCEAGDWELSRKDLVAKYPDWEEDVVKINLLDTVFLKDSDDGDNGFLAVEGNFI